MNTYRCIVKYGHAGSGKYTEKSIFVKASSVTDAMVIAKSRRGVKKGNNFRTGASVLEVTKVK